MIICGHRDDPCAVPDDRDARRGVVADDAGGDAFSYDHYDDHHAVQTR